MSSDFQEKARRPRSAVEPVASRLVTCHPASTWGVGGAVEILLLTEQWRGAPRSRVHPEPWLDRRRHGRRLRPVQAAWASDQR